MDLHHKQTFFNELASRWDQFPSPPDAPAKVARFVARCLGDSARRVLDVGCGTGILLPHIRDSVAAPREIVELDLAEAMLRENRKKPGAARAGHVCAAVQRPPFRPGAFDRILCFNALPHLNPIDDSLRQMLDCLCSEGLLSIGHLMESAELNQFHSNVGGAVSEDRLPTARDLVAQLTAMGAEVIFAEEEVGWYFVQVRRP